MTKKKLILLIATVFLYKTLTISDKFAYAQASPFNEPEIPNSLGVSVHFTHPQPGEMSQLATSGVRWIRMDLDWKSTEPKKGVYDFSAYDHLVSTAKKYNIKILFILNYANPLYDKGLSPYTNEGRRAFSSWVATAVKRYKGNKILWEMYNEPNIGFWKPKPNVNHYILLAKSVGEAIRRVSPKEIYIGPAVSRIDIPFLEACFKANLLMQWSAVTVHPYRNNFPETVIPEYQQLRRLISKYAPKNKKIPILSSEWGYASNNIGVETQGKYLARQWLTNLSNGIPLSIWYDWRDDGLDPKNAEHNFGMVYHTYNQQTSIYKLKPAYLASRTLINTLKGLNFYKRLNTAKSDNYVLFFKQFNRVVIVAWTTAVKPRSLNFSVPGNSFQVVTHMGEKKSIIQSKNRNLFITITDSPNYFILIK